MIRIVTPIYKDRWSSNLCYRHLIYLTIYVLRHVAINSSAVQTQTNYKPSVFLGYTITIF